MLTLNDGRSELWQWDTGSKLTVDADCSQVHFSNNVFGRSIDVDVIGGVAIIPDILLQTDKDLNVWAFVGTPENGYTKISKVFKVNRRNKPSDYVFTHPEQTTLGEILERLDDLESVKVPDAIKNAVEDYLEQNPVEVPVQSVNGQTGEVKLTAGDVGAISQDDLQEATSEALAQAKASGEFDGPQGPKGDHGEKGDKGAHGEPGKDGADGKDGTSATHSWNGTVLTITSASGTSSADLKGDPGEPGVDGADYILTDADKTEIAEMAAELVEVPDSGGNVAYDEEQELTEEQKAQARANIGAQPVGEYLTEVPEGYAKNEDIKKVDRKVDTLREVVSKFHSNIVCDSKGEVITVSDASDMELAGLRIFGKTTQDGTPTPEAPVELVSVGDGGSVSVTVCGKNFVDLQHSLKEGNTVGGNVTITKTANSVIISGVSGSTWISTGYYYYLPAGTYTYSAKMETDIGYMNLGLYVSNNLESGFIFKTALTSSGHQTFTLDKPMYAEVRCHFTGDSGTNGKTWTTGYYDIQIEKGSIATVFEPGNHQILTISTPNGLPGIPVASGGNYTDENGQQWLCDEVDFEKGVYVQRVGVVDYSDSNAPWATPKRTIDATKNKWELAKDATYIASPTIIGDILCTVAASGTGNQTYLCEDFICNEGNAIVLYLEEIASMGETAANAWLRERNVKVLYILAEAKEHPLSEIDPDALAQYAAMHTVYPNTTVFNDRNAGMEVKYVADTKLYIDKKFAELSAALLNQ